ncbi:MAG: S1 RNA-binding domain-containing protein [Chthoniobacter sp.]
MDTIKIGSTVKGVVKNLTDFGAFIDLDGMDGLLHITDMTWGRLGHPANWSKSARNSTSSSSISTRRRSASPSASSRPRRTPGKRRKPFPPSAQGQRQDHQPRPYGAFVEIEEGVEGLIHVSELSWTKRHHAPVRRAHRGPGSRSRGARREQRGAENLPRRPPARTQSLGRNRASLPDRPPGQGHRPQPHRVRRFRPNSKRASTA